MKFKNAYQKFSPFDKNPCFPQGLKNTYVCNHSHENARYICIFYKGESI